MRYKIGVRPNLTAGHNLETWTLVDRHLSQHQTEERAELLSICKNHKHPNGAKGFVRYCIKNGWLVEVVDKFLLERRLNETSYAEETEDAERIYEGAVISRLVNRFERNPAGRQICLDHHGYSCRVCDFNFEKKYGEVGKDFIHVHHIVPIHLIGKSYELDPIKDLVPVCPNCHAMIHRSEPIFSVEELRAIVLTSEREFT